MRRRYWEDLSIVVLCLPILGPLLWCVRILCDSSAWEVGREWPRLLALLRNSTLLVCLTVPPTIILGTILAFALVRLDLRGRRTAFGLCLGLVFVPLPSLAAAWKNAWPVAVGWTSTGLLGDIGELSKVPWRDLGFAAFVHGIAALPWVVGCVALGIAQGDRELEDDLRLLRGSWGVVRWVLLPRALPSIGMGLLIVLVQVLNEITIVDLLGVRTFAEEVYVEMVVPQVGPGRALAACTPQFVGALVLAFYLGRAWLRSAAIRPSLPSDSPLFRGSAWLTLPVWGFLTVLLGVPIVSLFVTAGRAHESADFSFGYLGREVLRGVRLHAGLLIESLFWSFVAAGLSGAWIVLIGTAALDRPRRHRFLVTLVLLVGVLPGPVVGMALKGCIDRLLDWEEHFDAAIMRYLLYDGPSPLPVLWAQSLRVLPIMFLLLWPSLRRVPSESRDLIRTLGGGSTSILRFVVVPEIRCDYLSAVALGTAFLLGEFSAGKLVQIPGRWTYLQEMFNQMHYGTTSMVAVLAAGQMLTACLLFGAFWKTQGAVREYGHLPRP